jgi:FAD dependent oxidoreductase
MMKLAALLTLLLPLTLRAATEADICIYGGTSAGVIAAVQGAAEGRTVVLVEAGQHLGGMSVEGLGGTDIDNHKGFQNSPAVGGLALEFYRRISAHYGKGAAFDEMIRTRSRNASLWRFEPHVAEAVFDAWVRQSGVTALRGHRLRERGGVSKDGPLITALHFENGAEVRAKVFIDATYEGDLLAFAGIGFAVGREGNAKYGETKNGIQTDTHHGQFDKRIDPYRTPGDAMSGLIHGVQDGPIGHPGAADESIQGYCFRLCLTKSPANRISIAKPASYDPAHYELQRRYLAAGGVITPPSSGIPGGKTDPGSWHHLAGNFTGWNHRYPLANYAERAEMLRTSRDYIHGLYWFMANDASVPAAQRELWSAWGLCSDEFTDNEGWPRAFYVRNGRRMVSDFVLTEAHLRKTKPEPISESVGMIFWPPDLHHARRIVKKGAVWNEGAVFESAAEADWQPCGIPYRCFVPKATECVNLLTPTCPSSSYVGYGAYRIEFTFMVAAQSCATAAAIAIEDSVPVQQVGYEKLKPRLQHSGQILNVMTSK